MGERTNISWCDATFNPWIGCAKVSDGCKFCYALDLMETRYKRVKWGPTGTRERTSAANWRKPLQWNKQAQAEGKRLRVFCASLADVFEDRPELAPWRADLFDLIIKTPHLDWLLLTKRPENISRMTPAFWTRYEWPKHVWIGTSVENQEAADKRIPELLNVPASVRFLSCEPLLGPVVLPSWDSYVDVDGFENNGPMRSTLGLSFEPDNLINWVIVGGESGHHARPMQIEWARSLVEQCQEAGVACWFKQLGGAMDKRHNLEDLPVDLRVREFPV